MTLIVTDPLPGLRIRTKLEENADEMENTCMRTVIDAGKVSCTNSHGDPVPYTPDLINAIEEFNANVPATGDYFNIKEKQLMNAYLPIFNQLKSSIETPEISERVPATMWEGLYRLMFRTELALYFLQTEGALPLILASLKSHMEGVIFYVLMVLKGLVLPSEENRNKELETANKKTLFENEEFINTLFDTLDHYATKSTGTLIILIPMDLFQSCLSDLPDTTAQAITTSMLTKLSERHTILLSLFHSNCSGITMATALIMKTIVEESKPEVASLMQEAALSEGVLIRHFYNAIFASSEDQRFISRYLVGLWMGQHEDSRALLSRIVPLGMTRYLDAPPLDDEAYAKCIVCPSLPCDA